MVLVPVGGTYQYDRQEISCRETWANPQFHPKDCKVYFVRGNPAMPKTAKTVDEIIATKVDIDHDTRTIYADVPDAWGYLTFKGMLALVELSKSFSWDYFVRPNSGSYANLNLLSETLKSLPNRNMMYSVPMHYMGVNYGSGACFTVTSDLSDKLLNSLHQAMHTQMHYTIADDVLYGHIMGGKIHAAPRIEVGRISEDGKKTPIGKQVTDDPLSWFDSTCYHYWFASSRTDKAHYAVHKLFYPS